MEKNNQEQKNSSEKPTNKIKQEKAEAIQSLASNLLKDEKNIDIGSIFKMANKLIKDDSLMAMVNEIGKKPERSEGTAVKETMKEGTEAGTKKASEDRNGIEDEALVLLNIEIEEIKAELKKTQKEVAELKKQNASLLNLFLKVINAANQDLKKSVELLSGLSKLLK
ncbi:hypothetical protein [Cytobacillus oceanisediminis]|uniref:Uncharacterized protein n=1 Tax=Cytobacillus oceanisediminis TaxID=665099 RepID=A0A562JEE5_9BACI|nr:hypothetical protein [Cytobacillus oceanisediminis]TWH81255.1 hypothetical protein IQ19_04298 [Cytobacillus oceanisediminis]